MWKIQVELVYTIMLKLLAMKGTGKLAALPLSYINRFFTEAARTSKQKEQSVDTMTAPEQHVLLLN